MWYKILQKNKVNFFFTFILSFIILFFFLEFTIIGKSSALTYTRQAFIGQNAINETAFNDVSDERGFHLGGVHVHEYTSSGDISMYVYDSGNNRILGFLNPNFSDPNEVPDIIIGQNHPNKGACNGDNTIDAGNTDEYSLCLNRGVYAISQEEEPRFSGMDTDNDGNLFVLDQYNNRVLKFDNPFDTSMSEDDRKKADDVWGQSDFSGRICNHGRGIAVFPYVGYLIDSDGFCTSVNKESSTDDYYGGSVDIDIDNNLWVTDTVNNRILRFPFDPILNDISKNADIVVGQDDLQSFTKTYNACFYNMQDICKPYVIKVNDVSRQLFIVDGEKLNANPANEMSFRIAIFDPAYDATGTNIIDYSFANELGVSRVGSIVNDDGRFFLPRGIVFEHGPSAIFWFNDTDFSSGLDRLVRMDSSGNILHTFDTDTLRLTGSGIALYQINGEISLDSANNLYIAEQVYNNSIIKFNVTDPADVIDIGEILEGEKFVWNTVCNTSLASPYGLAYDSTNKQLFSADDYRVLVWDGVELSTVSDNDPADFVIGRPDFTSNSEVTPSPVPPGEYYFSDIFRVSGVTVDSNNHKLWVSRGPILYAFALPITTDAPEPERMLYSGQYDASVLFGENIGLQGSSNPVKFSAYAIEYDNSSDALWIADHFNSVVYRIDSPLSSSPEVNLVLGQELETDLYSKSERGIDMCNKGHKNNPDASTLCNPSSIAFDNHGNLYIAEGSYEGRPDEPGNKRIVSFNASKIKTPVAGAPFADLEADRVYGTDDIDNDPVYYKSGCLPILSPCNPISISFDRDNRMAVTTDAYFNDQQQRIYIYSDPLRVSGTGTNYVPFSQVDGDIIVNEIMGQGGEVIFDYSGNLIVQDHTWNRLLYFETDSPIVSLPHELDIVLLIDVTGSMSGEIINLKAEISSIIDELFASERDIRVAVAKYKGFSPEPYLWKINTDFTSIKGDIESAVNELFWLGQNEAPYSPLINIINGNPDDDGSTLSPWRADAEKSIVLITDAEPTDPAEIYDTTSVITAANNAPNGPINIYSILTGGSARSHNDYYTVAEQTGGKSVETFDIDSGTDTGERLMALTQVISENSYVNFEADVLSGPVPLTVNFTDKSLAKGTIQNWQWDFDYDGTVDSTSQNPTYTYPGPGYYDPRLSIYDGVSYHRESKSQYIYVQAYQNIEVDPTTWDYSQLAVGESQSQTFTITNTGETDLTIGTISLAGANQTEFTIESLNDNCSDATLVSSASCTLEVDFQPASEGEKNAMVLIPSNDPDTQTLEVSLHGNALDSSRFVEGEFVWVEQWGGSSTTYYYDTGLDIATDPSGNALVTGTRSLNDLFGRDAYIAKYDTDSNLMWSEVIGGQDHVNGTGITSDSNGNVIATGFFAGTITFQVSSLSGYDSYVVKYDSSGNLLWLKTATGALDVRAYKIITDNEDNILVVGGFKGNVTFDENTTIIGSPNNDTYDLFVAKYDSFGNLLWAKALAEGGFAGGMDIDVDSDNNILISGSFLYTITFNGQQFFSAGGTDIFVSKHDTNGDLLWVKLAGGTDFDFARGVVVDANDSILVTGDFIGTVNFDDNNSLTNPDSYFDLYIVKYNKNGKLTWLKQAEGTESVTAGDINTDAEGNIVLTGTFRSTATFENEILISSSGSRDVFVAKYDSYGNLRWINQCGGPESDGAEGIATDSANNIFITGSFNNIANFSDITLTSNGISDSFIGKIEGFAPSVISNFTANVTTGIEPLTVNFTDTSSALNTSISTWEWDFDSNGTIDSTVQHPTHTFQNSGKYTVSLKVSDGNGLDDTVTKENYIQVYKTCATSLCNGDFESASDFEYWIPGNGTNQMVTDIVQHGSKAFNSEHTYNPNVGPRWSGVSQVVTVSSAQIYELRGYYQSENVAQGHIKIMWKDQSGTTLQVDYPLTNVNGTNSSWVEFSKLVTSPAGSSSAVIYIWHGLNSSNQNVLGSKLWMDSLAFNKVAGCGVLCNENFEQGTLYWSLSGAAGAHTIEQTGAYDGIKALKSEQLYTSGDPVKWAGITQFAQVKEGITYRIRGWFKTLNTSNGHIRIRWRDISGNILSTEYPISGISGTNSTWSNQEGTITAPTSATKAEVTIWHGVTVGPENFQGSTIWVDNITMICQNLCNAGFEDGHIHWEANGTNEEGEIITTDVQEGSQSIKVVQNLIPTDNTQWVGISQRVLVTEGSDYNLYIWVKKLNTVEGHVKIKWRDTNDQLVLQEFPKTGMNGTDTDWIRPTMTVTAPANAETVEIFIWHGVNGANQNATGSTLYIDNVNFVQQ